MQENGISNVFALFEPNKKGFVKVSVRLKGLDNLEDCVNSLVQEGLVAVSGTKEWVHFQLRTKE